MREINFFFIFFDYRIKLKSLKFNVYLKQYCIVLISTKYIINIFNIFLYTILYL